ncbi:MAG: hypothetical protein CVV37_00265 [Nitrospira bacterium HGW-Nitrospira-1]|nr:MAG: hypothetical protein CVV37_00265 [Nitrospira bacterium HGW-Nitrospira-1]
MMAFRLILLFLSFVMVCLTYSFGNAAETYSKNPCLGEANLVCLQDNFDKLYRENYPLFWKILHNAATKAQKCDSVEDTATFLRLVKLIRGSQATGSAEFEEYFSQTVEQLCIQKSKCFLDGLLMLDKSTRVLLIDMLRTPLFVDNSKIDRVFLDAKTNKKYRKISDIYFLKR